MTITQWLHATTTELTQAGIDSARLDAELLLGDALAKDRTWLLAHSDEAIPPTTLAKANGLRKLRAQRIPLAYLRGWQEFYGHRFFVTPDVLIPRPETETILELIAEFPHAKQGTLIDVGTGSGAIGLSAAYHFPELAVILVDISQAALTVAEKNRAQLSVEARLVCSDLLQAINEKAQFIVANLPYVGKDWQRSPETHHEPDLALFAEQDGLAIIFKLLEQATTKLCHNGLLLLEADPRQHSAIKNRAHELGFTPWIERGFVVGFLWA